MKDFLFVFRTDYSKMPKGSPEEMQALSKRWMDWIGGIGAQGNLVDRGNRLVPGTGKVVKPASVITDGPYMEIKESIGGYTIVKANSLEEAAALAKGCPILNFGGNVEVREISAL
ncbi:transcription initiation protein [Fulvivirgaceae bacterium PWU4]|uniref:Transcription initiation protein n=1 Tax=Chryseosolibacter histidini TaxID=2782349 RepID=A0AAP2DKH7_9BACT|nr:YciI family protein [Chryseosolibacter histidini]MBT1696657.1 transcription initiation protein [Chryseosolibacter histidini]